jgi:uncharacterized membrane protein YdjX (TVP38/TMEM64 family)
VPRTVLTLSAGLLLGPALGYAVAVTATIVAGAAGYWAARLLGGELLTRHIHRDVVRTVYDRLTRGGALAVASLRLIPVVPFAPLSYCCGMSAFRFRPYLWGTLLGSLPGTAAVVVLGDALTGATPPALVACYAALAVIGSLGVWRLVRTPVPAGDARYAPGDGGGGHSPQRLTPSTLRRWTDGGQLQPGRSQGTRERRPAQTQERPPSRTGN